MYARSKIIDAFFIGRQNIYAWYWYRISVCPSVCPSVCLTDAGMYISQTFTPSGIRVPEQRYKMPMVRSSTGTSNTWHMKNLRSPTISDIRD